MAAGVIAVATSIPPHLVRRDGGCDLPDYQALCVQSWIANGFRVISVNHADEIAFLAARYPDVRFVATDRDARQWTGRKNPYIADLLLALKDADEPVLGLINSDLLFEPSAAWVEQLPPRVPHTMIVAHRYNTNSLRHGALRRFQGWDCFFFDKTMALAALEKALPFAIGAPWWDYWLPCLALLNGRRVTVVERPAILHLTHDTAYSQQSQEDFGNAFADTILAAAEDSEGPLSPAIAALIPPLREIAERSLESAERKRKYWEISEGFELNIRHDRQSWSAPAVSSSAPASVTQAFDRLEQRLSAGAALKQAKVLLAQKPAVDVEPEPVEALKQTPEDPDTLLTLGEIYRRRGEFGAAMDVCARAAKLLPGAAAPLQGQGVVLCAEGRREEALSCFRRALEIEPTHQPSCIGAARTLCDMDRRQDAIRFLDDILARHPDLTRVAGFRDQLTKP